MLGNSRNLPASELHGRATWGERGDGCVRHNELGERSLDSSLRAVVRVQWSGRVGKGRGECEGGFVVGMREWGYEQLGIE